MRLGTLFFLIHLCTFLANPYVFPTRRTYQCMTGKVRLVIDSLPWGMLLQSACALRWHVALVSMHGSQIDYYLNGKVPLFQYGDMVVPVQSGAMPDQEGRVLTIQAFPQSWN